MEKLPLVGFGTWELRGDECARAVEMAYELGYRHFDTALLYENHKVIQKTLKGCPDVIYTSKFMHYHLDEMSVEAACIKCCEQLDVESLDCFLMHYPDTSRPMKQIVEQLGALVDKGLAKMVGGSNFSIKHFEVVDSTLLSIDQVEFHPYLQQKKLRAYLKKHEMELVAFRTLGKGALTNDPIFASIGEKYGKSASQIALRWVVQQDIAVIPKSTSKEHMKENIEVLDFVLSDEDMNTLSHLTEKGRFCQNSWCDF